MVDPADFWHILPYYAKKDVVHYLDIKTRCNLSYCSKSDLALVKSTPIAFQNITWIPGDRRNSDSAALIHFTTLNGPKEEKTVKFENTSQIVDHLIKMLRAPNICDTLFNCSLYYQDVEQQELGELIRQLDVQNIHPKIKRVHWTLVSGDLFYEFFKRIDENYLDGIEIHFFRQTGEQAERIMATEQWKRLNVVNIMDFMDSLAPELPLDGIIDKPMFSITISNTPEWSVTVDTARSIVETFKSKNHPCGCWFLAKFRHCDLNLREMYEDPGMRMGDVNDVYYLKKFPLADDLELRVILRASSILKFDKISGVVARKDAEVTLAKELDIIRNCVFGH